MTREEMIIIVNNNKECNIDEILVFNRIAMHLEVSDKIVEKAFEMIQDEKRISDYIIAQAKKMIKEENDKKRTLSKILGLHWNDIEF